MQTGAAPMVNSVEVPQKVKSIELPYDLVIALLDIYLKNTKMCIQRDTCTPMFIVASFLAKLWKQPKCALIDEWIKRRV